MANIVYMPYAPVKNPFTIGSYEVWPFHRECEARVKNPAALGTLREMFESHRENGSSGRDGIISEVYVVSPGGFVPGTDVLTPADIENIKRVCHVIAFSAINEPFQSSCSDAFALFLQAFRPGEKTTRIWNKEYQEMTEIRIHRPYHLDSSLVGYEKTSLCDVLGKALENPRKKNLKRIFKALELFYHAATHSELVSDEFRAVTLATCFESLLGFRNKNDFGKKIEDLVEVKNPIEKTRTVTLKKSGKNVKQKHTAPATVWWAYDLYDLRKDIVHSNKVDWNKSSYGDVHARIEFGKILLRKVIKSLLVKEKLLKKAFGFAVEEAILDPDNLDERLEQIVEKNNARS